MTPSRSTIHGDGVTPLAERINRFARLATSPTPRIPVDERPGCAYGAVTRQAVQDLRDQSNRIEAKVNAILGGISIALVVQVLLAVAK
ncbi:MAG: hypothetical protein ACYC3S_18220 [Chloroflexota bacterium]